jgi:hypothetical protein
MGVNRRRNSRLFRRRLTPILSELFTTLRSLRAIQVLEQIGTPETKEVLLMIACGKKTQTSICVETNQP